MPIKKAIFNGETVSIFHVVRHERTVLMDVFLENPNVLEDKVIRYLVFLAEHVIFTINVNKIELSG